MELRVADNPDAGRYEIFADGKLAGFTRYRPARDHVTFWHTEVDPAFSGAGLGARLAHDALADVASKGGQIMPLCPFMAGYIRKHPELLEAVVPSVRQRLAAQVRAG